METKIQSFQFSFLHRFCEIVHNARLFKMQLIESESCDTCFEKDTIIHRFLECPTITLFWENFEQWWNSLYPNNSVLLSAETILFGIYSTKSQYALNNCILQAKYFIHKQLCNKQQVTFRSFLSYLKFKISTELYILCSKGKYELFKKRWSVIFHSID